MSVSGKTGIQIVKSVLLSYSQIFFSRNLYFALILVVVTFVDPITGLAGLISVLATNFFAWVLGFDRESIIHGDYGFNSVLTGLGLGILYNPSVPFFLLIVVASLATFIFTIVVAGILKKYGLPYLSIPFLLAIWTFILASRNFESLTISARGVYKLNELYATGQDTMINAYHWLNEFPLPEVIKVYFKSLGAILFQFNILPGMIIAAGLMIYSRIAFSLSLVSFILAYYFFLFMGADLNMLSYTYIGFNFILSGIALGSFYLVPSKESYLWSFLLIPVLLILTASLSSLFYPIQLSIYSLPFNIVVISFLFVLKLRYHPGNLKEVPVQHFQPEANLYHHLTGKKRFQYYRATSICLPVFGQWLVSQGHNGTITHKGEWKDAFDLVITDDEGKTYKGEGHIPEQYFCYDKPAIAPADGEVVELVSFLNDNRIGEADLKNNWGNSLVLRHGEHLFSQLSHLKPESIRVKKGDFVKKGDILAKCGNSGRSPEPHLHFQIQSTPSIGSRTLNYPIGHYISEKNGTLEYHFFDFPDEGTRVQPVIINEPLAETFHFQPGRIMKFRVQKGNNLKTTEIWEVKTDTFNNTYLQCMNNGAAAYFTEDGTIFYFTHFTGKRNCLLYQFFLGAHRVVFHEIERLIIQDEIPLHLFSRSLFRHIYDFTAPFLSWMRIEHHSAIKIINTNTHKTIQYEGKVGRRRAGKFTPGVIFNMEISGMCFSIITVESQKTTWKADYIGS